MNNIGTLKVRKQPWSATSRLYEVRGLEYRRNVRAEMQSRGGPTGDDRSLIDPLSIRHARDAVSRDLALIRRHKMEDRATWTAFLRSKKRQDRLYEQETECQIIMDIVQQREDDKLTTPADAATNTDHGTSLAAKDSDDTAKDSDDTAKDSDATAKDSGCVSYNTQHLIRMV